MTEFLNFKEVTNLNIHSSTTRIVGSLWIKGLAFNGIQKLSRVRLPAFSETIDVKFMVQWAEKSMHTVKNIRTD